MIPLALLPLAALLIWLGVSQLDAMGAAYASLLSVAGAATIVVGYIWRRFRPTVNGLSLVRIALAAVVVWGAARLWMPSGLILILSYGALGGLYLLLLLGLGEIKRQDVALVRTWLSFPLQKKSVRRGTDE
jgi:hypothetical protein